MALDLQHPISYYISSETGSQLHAQERGYSTSGIAKKTVRSLFELQVGCLHCHVLLT